MGSNRIVWVLIGLLVVTNAAWFLSQGLRPERGPSEPGEEPVREGSREPDSGAPPISSGSSVPRPGAGNPLAGKGLEARGETELDAERIRELRKQWTKDAVESKDPARKQQVVDEITHSLAQGTPEQVVAALQTLPWIKDTGIDPAMFRPFLKTRVVDRDPRIRRAAVEALTVLDPEREDITTLLILVHDPSRDVRKALPKAIGEVCDWQILGEPAFAFIDLMNDEDLSVRLATLRALNAAQTISADVVGHVLPLRDSKDRLTSLRAVNALAGAHTIKAEPVVEMLIRTLTHEDPEFREEARQGLLHGIRDEFADKVLATLVPAYRVQTDLEDRKGNLELLQVYGREAHLPMIRETAEDPNAPEIIRRTANETVKAIRRRSKG